MTRTGSDVILERMMTLHPKVIDLVLDRVHRLLAALDHPETKLPPVIHIAGTNGKGSTQAMIRAGLEAAGQRVHAYTSPHLVRFHERIRLAGTLITEDQLTAILDECYAANGGDPITYFEITTCAGLLAMARTPADHTLLEVGLGGEYDATNVIDHPALTIITPVSLDHEHFLGDTLEEIAAAKAGIIKRGVPCVVGPQPDAAMQVIEARAERLSAPLLAYGQHWHVTEERGRLVYQDERGLLDLPLPNLPGAHQHRNAGTALAALRAIGAPEAAYEGAVTGADWPGRMQALRSGRLPKAAPGLEIWLDGGHNPAAGQALADHLASLPTRETRLICAMNRTKDARKFFGPLTDQAASVTAIPVPGESALLSPEDTATLARDAGFTTVNIAPDISAALAAISEWSPNARVLICGSLYLAGHVLRENG